MTLPELISANMTDPPNAGQIAAALNATRYTSTEQEVTVEKPAGRATLESMLRALLDGLGVPTPIPAATLAAMLATTPQNDAHRDALTRAIAIRADLKSAEHGLTDADFLAAHFGQPTYTQTVTTQTAGPSLAQEHLGRDVTADEVRDVLREGGE